MAMFKPSNTFKHTLIIQDLLFSGLTVEIQTLSDYIELKHPNAFVACELSAHVSQTAYKLYFNP